MVQGKKQLRKAVQESKAIFAACIAHVGLPAPGDNAETTKQACSIPAKYAQWAHVFNENPPDPLPEHHGLEHRIELEENTKPPWGPIYPLADTELKVLRDYISDALAKGWIRPSTSPAGAPILFVPKKGGKLRLCVDYRGLNSITKKDRTPLPLINEILNRLSGAKIFTKIDMRDAYY